ncbi:alpha-1-antitrypsin-like protein GS55-MS [Ranitomeya variabilis]|uniref:alpha-1-antitrypsin-like protein GS55-MS n=1 Tax=Ranitomeya variabilis TaxID=490064 RepID=UPI00405705AE
MKLFIFLCFSQALICAFVCGHHGGPHDDDHDHDGQHNNEPEASHQVVTGILKFSFKLYYQLVDAHPDDNLLFSPLSIAKAFALLSLGAKSKTLSQIHEGIGFNKSSVSEEMIHKGFQKLLNIIKQPKSGLELDSTIALFIDSKLNILKKFLDDAQNFYQSEAISTDFHKVQEALEQINSYVEKRTNGKIKHLLDKLDPLTVMMITSTMYFKGSWEHAFNVDHTREEDFHVDENTVVKVPMMSRQGEYLTGYIPEIGCRFVDVPYKGNTSAVFMLPDKGKFLEVEKALENLSEEAWIKAMKPREIILSIPKFSMSGELDLVKELEQLGMTEVFSDHADLSGITGDSRLKLSKAVHKAVLKMDEEGTEAAAATGIGITMFSSPPCVTFDRPFLFAIHNKDISNDIFSGRMMNPTK